MQCDVEFGLGDLSFSGLCGNCKYHVSLDLCQELRQLHTVTGVRSMFVDLGSVNAFSGTLCETSHQTSSCTTVIATMLSSFFLCIEWLLKRGFESIVV